MGWIKKSKKAPTKIAAAELRSKPTGLEGLSDFIADLRPDFLDRCEDRIGPEKIPAAIRASSTSCAKLQPGKETHYISIALANKLGG